MFSLQTFLTTHLPCNKTFIQPHWHLFGASQLTSDSSSTEKISVSLVFIVNIWKLEVIYLVKTWIYTRQWVITFFHHKDRRDQKKNIKIADWLSVIYFLTHYRLQDCCCLNPVCITSLKNRKKHELDKDRSFVEINVIQHISVSDKQGLQSFSTSLSTHWEQTVWAVDSLHFGWPKVKQFSLNYSS